MSAGNVNERIYTVLLVEDNPDDIILTREAFAESGFEVCFVVARHVDEAISTLSALNTSMRLPDLIMLDLNLPVKSGIVFLKHVKNNQHLCSVPVVVLSTSKADDDISRSYRLHANSYIAKPIDMNDFIEIIRTISKYWFSVTALPGRAL